MPSLWPLQINGTRGILMCFYCKWKAGKALEVGVLPRGGSWKARSTSDMHVTAGINEHGPLCNVQWDERLLGRLEAVKELHFTSHGWATRVPAFLSAASGEVGISSLPVSCSCFRQKPMGCCRCLFSFGLVVLEVQSRTKKNMPRAIKSRGFYFPSFITGGRMVAVEGRILLQV